MSLLYFFAATRDESRALDRCSSLRWTVSLGKRKTGASALHLIELFVTGVGPAAAEAEAVRAGRAIRAGEAPRPDVVFVIGACGSLSSDLGENQVVAYTGCLLASGSAAGWNAPKLDCSPTLTRHTISALDAAGVRARQVTGVTSSRIAVRREEKLRLAAQGASAVDMESYIILSKLSALDVPCIVLRVVSDSLERELPDFNPAIRPDGGVEKGRAARIAMASPLASARMMVAQRKALRALSRALELVLISGELGAAFSGRRE